MSTKDWKNGELKSLLTEAWGFKMDLNKLNEATMAPGELKNEIVAALDADDDEPAGPGRKLPDIGAAAQSAVSSAGVPQKALSRDIASRGQTVYDPEKMAAAEKEMGSAYRVKPEEKPGKDVVSVRPSTKPATPWKDAAAALGSGMAQNRAARQDARAEKKAGWKAGRADKKSDKLAKRQARSARRKAGDIDLGPVAFDQAEAGSLGSRLSQIASGPSAQEPKAKPAPATPAAGPQDGTQVPANLGTTEETLASTGPQGKRDAGRKARLKRRRSGADRQDEDGLTGLAEMCGPEHDEAEIVVMGGEDVVGDEAADPAERVAALMDELKDLLMQLAGGGEEIETTLNEKKWGKGKIKPQSPEHRAAIDPEMLDEPSAKFDWRDALSPRPHSQSPEAAAARAASAVLGIKTGPGQGDTAPPPKKRRDTAAPAVTSATKSKDTGDDEETNESREEQLREMVRKAIREAMK